MFASEQRLGGGGILGAVYSVKIKRKMGKRAKEKEPESSRTGKDIRISERLNYHDFSKEARLGLIIETDISKQSQQTRLNIDFTKARFSQQTRSDRTRTEEILQMP